MKVKTWIPFFVILFTVSSFSQKFGKRNDCENNYRFQGKCIVPDLTDEQLQAIEDIKLNYREKVIDIKTKIEKDKIEIEKILNSKEIDLEEIKRFMKINAELLTKIRETRIDMTFEISEKLNPEQKELWIKKHLDKRKYLRDLGKSRKFRNRQID